jgi:hypothetical protein
MEFEIKFTGDLDDSQKLTQLLRAGDAFDALWKIRKLALELKAYTADDSIIEPVAKEMTKDEYIDEVLEYLDEILEWTQIEGMY